MTQTLTHATVATSSDIKAIIDYCKACVLDEPEKIGYWRDGHHVADVLLSRCIGIDHHDHEEIGISVGYWLSMAKQFLNGANAETLFRHNPTGEVTTGPVWLMKDRDFWSSPENCAPSWSKTWTKIAA